MTARSLLLLLVFLGLGLAACGDDRPLVVIAIEGVPAGTAQLRAVPSLDGRQGMALAVPADAGRFSLRLPAGTRGKLAVSVVALDNSDGECARASGQVTADITDDVRIDVSVTLTAAGAGACLKGALVVQRSGPGQGTVTSDPAGIDCGAQCTASFALGGRLTLSALPDRDSYFAGWSGACAGTDPCTLTVSGQLMVTAHFAVRVCSPDRMCWEYPFPQGNNLLGLSGTGGKDIWAVGEGGTILHHDGTAWSGVKAPGEQALGGAFAVSDQDVWAVGEKGTALHYTGGDFAATDTGDAGDFLAAVWGSGPTNVFAVGGVYDNTRNVILQWNGSVWARMDSAGTTKYLQGVWGTRPDDVWAVGYGGLILHWNGNGWAAVASGVTDNLTGVWGTAPDDMWAVGWAGRILHWDGKTWQAVDSGVTANLSGIHGVGPADIWAVGAGTLLHWNGSRWDKRSSRFTGLITKVWGAPGKPDDIWAVGQLGTLLHWNGTAWDLITSGSTRLAYAGWGTGPDDVWLVGEGYAGYEPVLHWSGGRFAEVHARNSLRSIWGSRKDDIWTVGREGAIQHYQGKQWTDVPSPALVDLLGIWGTGPDDIWICGDGGTLLHYGGGPWTRVQSGTMARLNSIWGSRKDDIWTVGEAGMVLHYNGTQWMPVDSGTMNNLRSVWGSGADDVWAGGGSYGDPSTLLHWKGGGRTAMPTGSVDPVNGIWGSGPADVWVVIDGHDKNLLHYDGMSFTPLRTGGAGVPLSGVYGVSPRDVFVFGFQGMILRYRP